MYAIKLVAIRSNDIFLMRCMNVQKKTNFYGGQALANEQLIDRT